MSLSRELIGVADLRLDDENPRHATVANDREAIQALLRDDGGKLLKLAQDIATRGLNPTDVFLVLREKGDVFTVLEGNRRLAALKLLANSGIADEPRYRDRFREAARGMAPIVEVWCAVVPSREEAKYWQELRHTGERSGVGIVGWNAEAIARFNSRRRSRADLAIHFIDNIIGSYPNNRQLQSDLRTLRRTRFTNLERFVDDPDVRKRLGLEFRDEKAVWHYEADVLESTFERIVGDLAGPIAVGGIFNKQRRAEYLESINAFLPDPMKRKAIAEPLKASGRKQTRKPKTSPPARLFKGVKLEAFGPRVSSMLAELQQIDIERFPNSAAVLIRVVIELATGGVAEVRNWPEETLAKTVRRCLAEVDPSGKAPQFEAVRRGLAQQSSLMAVQTIHKFVHNKYFNPSPTDLRAWADNYSPFLQALDDLLPKSPRP